MNDMADGAVCGPAGCDAETGAPRVLAAKQSSSPKVEIVSDAICPWCYVAKRHFESALTQLPQGVKVSVHWLPFELNPDMPVGGKDRRAYRSAKFGSWENSQKLDAEVATAGAQAGLRMRHDLMQRTPNTFNAHRLIWLAGQEGLQEPIVEALFRAYFVEGRDVGNVDVLIDIGSRGGIAHDRVQAFFAGYEGVAEVSKAARSASQSGMSGVPTFIINGQPAFSGALRAEAMLTHSLGALAA